MPSTVFVKKIFRRIKSFVFYFDQIYLLEKLNHIDLFGIDEVFIKRVNFENVDDAKSFQSEHYINCFKDFLKSGEIGYFAYLKDICVHRSWVQSSGNAILHSKYSIELKENECFIKWCETASSARGLGIYPFVLKKITDDFSDNRILISVNCKNIASLKGVKKAGFLIIQRISIIVILGIKFVKVKRYDK